MGWQMLQAGTSWTDDTGTDQCRNGHMRPGESGEVVIVVVKNAVRSKVACLSCYGSGIGSSGLPGAIDEQFCGAGRPSKRCWIQAIEFGTQSTRLAMWPSKSYCS